MVGQERVELSVPMASRLQRGGAPIPRLTQNRRRRDSNSQADTSAGCPFSRRVLAPIERLLRMETSEGVEPTSARVAAVRLPGRCSSGTNQIVTERGASDLFRSGRRVLFFRGMMLW